MSRIPKNIIINWAGSLETIPEGWVLCNGSNNTPDLRDRFVVGSGNKYTSLDIGGFADTVLVSHNHSATGSTTTTHNHTWSSRDQKYGGGGYANSPTSTGTLGTNSAGGHSHSLAIESEGEDPTGKNLPPYYALYFILYGGV